MKENISTVFSRMKKTYGLGHTLKFGFSVLTQFIILGIYYKAQKFSFKDEKYNYFINFLNGTHTNERIIEIPLILNILKKNEYKKILEVGNVISKYYNFPHTIIDKYEKAENVFNEDVVDFHPNEKYDLIFSISTMEHVGFDEDEKDSEKILRSFENLKSLLQLNGKIIVTMPLGYNKYLDDYIKKGKLGFDNQFFFKKDQKYNTWKEMSSMDISKAKYENKFPPHANELILAIFKKKN